MEKRVETAIRAENTAMSESTFDRLGGSDTLLVAAIPAMIHGRREEGYKPVDKQVMGCCLPTS
jgi:hypothetical protein